MYLSELEDLVKRMRAVSLGQPEPRVYLDTGARGLRPMVIHARAERGVKRYRCDTVVDGQPQRLGDFTLPLTSDE